MDSVVLGAAQTNAAFTREFDPNIPWSATATAATARQRQQPLLRLIRPLDLMITGSNLGLNPKPLSAPLHYLLSSHGLWLALEKRIGGSPTSITTCCTGVLVPAVPTVSPVAALFAVSVVHIASHHTGRPGKLGFCSEPSVPKTHRSASHFSLAPQRQRSGRSSCGPPSAAPLSCENLPSSPVAALPPAKTQSATPRPLFSPTTLIIGDSIIRSMRFF